MPAGLLAHGSNVALQPSRFPFEAPVAYVGEHSPLTVAGAATGSANRPHRVPSNAARSRAPHHRHAPIAGYLPIAVNRSANVTRERDARSDAQMSRSALGHPEQRASVPSRPCHGRRLPLAQVAPRHFNAVGADCRYHRFGDSGAGGREICTLPPAARRAHVSAS